MRLLVIIISSLILLSNCTENAKSPSLLKSAHLQMGTKWMIQVESQDTAAARNAINTSWRLLDTLNALLTNYNSESEISRLAKLSGTGQWIEVHEYTIDVLQKSKVMYEASDGVFDITIGPASKLWRRSFQTKEWPSSTLLNDAMTLVGLQYLELDSTKRRARLTKRGMSLDLGGIGKGYAVDKICDLLEGLGYERYLVEGGGDLRVGAAPGGKLGWTVDRETLGPAGDIIILRDTVSNVAIATSGNAYQYIDHDDRRYQHHINPFTGRAANDIYSVVVKSDLCWKSDAISTAISILGADSIEMSGYEGYMIRGGEQYEQEGFMSHAATRDN